MWYLIFYREEKSFYTLRAQAVDMHTGVPLEPESEFIIKVQDINDNEPRFTDGPYSANVSEMSPTGRTTRDWDKVKRPVTACIRPLWIQYRYLYLLHEINTKSKQKNSKVLEKKNKV